MNLRATGRCQAGFVLKQRMIKRGLFEVLTANAKRDRAPDIIHDGFDMGLDLSCGYIETGGLIAAGNIITDAGRAYLVVVGHDATDGHAIAQVMISHEREGCGFVGAVDDLFDGVVQGFPQTGTP